jgi:hypothetical protein
MDIEKGRKHHACGLFLVMKKCRPRLDGTINCTRFFYAIGMLLFLTKTARDMYSPAGDVMLL